MLIRKIRKALRLKNIVHYAIIACVVWISLRFYNAYQTSDQRGRYKAYGPRDLRRGRGGPDYDDPWKADNPVHDLDNKQPRQSRLNDRDSDDEVRRDYKGRESRLDHEEQREGGDRDGDNKKDDADHKNDEDNVMRSGEEGAGKDGKAANKPPQMKGGKKEEFQVENKIDWILEEELQNRRKLFLEDVAKRAEEYDPNDFKDMQEADDHLAFITAATDKTSWAALLQFVYSVQYFYPHSDIGVYDLGLTEQQRKKLASFCRVSVNPSFTKFWPDHLTDFSKSLWKPMIWQMGLAHYGHIIFVEPERYLSKKNMKDYIQHSRRHGITVVGRKLQHSPFTVTHPEMYYFLNVDTRKLQRVSMFDVTMIVMHNSQPVRHEFMRHLVSCTLEEYCIAPPGSKALCDHRLYPGSKKYANCHRYDLSAVNILLDKWFDFRQEEFLVKDIATAHYDGKDVSNRIKVCSDREEI